MTAAHPDDTGGGVMGAGTGAQWRWGNVYDNREPEVLVMLLMVDTDGRVWGTCGGGHSTLKLSLCLSAATLITTIN